jgi:hypothetical protein
MSGAYESYEHVTADKIKAGDIISDRLPENENPKHEPYRAVARVDETPEALRFYFSRTEHVRVNRDTLVWRLLP